MDNEALISIRKLLKINLQDKLNDYLLRPEQEHNHMVWIKQAIECIDKEIGINNDK